MNTLSMDNALAYSFIFPVAQSVEVTIGVIDREIVIKHSGFLIPQGERFANGINAPECPNKTTAWITHGQE